MKVKRIARPASSWTPPAVEPNFAWGSSPFAPPDEPDEVRLAGLRLVRTPSGDFVGIRDPQDPKEKP